MFDYQRVRRLREYLQLSESQFAKKIGVAQSTYNRFEKGTASLTAEAISEIITLFDVNPYWLLLGRGGNDPEFINNAELITISKNEYIDLQRKALQNQDERIAALERELRKK